jgi:hypothetical protein
LNEGETKPSLQQRSSAKSNPSHKNGDSHPQKDSSSLSLSDTSNLYVANQLPDYGEAEICTGCNKKYVHAVTDLITETHFLAGLRHPHIVELMGVASPDTLAKDYFLSWKTCLEH